MKTFTADELRMRKELALLKAERKRLIADWGERGQLHPMSVQIGGLNPGAQALHGVRQRIAAIETVLRKKSAKQKAVITPMMQLPGHYGLSHVIEYQGLRAQAGTSNFGDYYVVFAEEGGIRDIVAQGLKTPAKARDAFVKWVDAGRRRPSPPPRYRVEFSYLDEGTEPREGEEIVEAGSKSEAEQVVLRGFPLSWKARILNAAEVE